MMSDKLIASEALYGFTGWLTTREKPITISARHDAGIMSELVGEFCKENKLSEPRDGWAENLIHPSGECSYKNEPTVKTNAIAGRYEDGIDRGVK